MFSSSLFFSVKIVSKTDLRAYFKHKAVRFEGTVTKEQIANLEIAITLQL